MGSADRPLPRLLGALKWRIDEIPFFFRVANAKAFLRNIAPLRSSTFRRLVSTLASISGAGSLGLRGLRAWKIKSIPLLSAQPINKWGSWADKVWTDASNEYSLIARRTAADLTDFLPIGRQDLVAWRFDNGKDIIGWAAGLVHRIPNSPYFGAMKVGTLLDCLCTPGYEQQVIATASALMETMGADILISNQTNYKWQQAFRASGYLSGPSNYLLGLSPSLNASVNLQTAHLTRADGDGRVNL